LSGSHSIIKPTGLPYEYLADRAPLRISCWPGSHARLMNGNQMNGGVGAAAAGLE